MGNDMQEDGRVPLEPGSRERGRSTVSPPVGFDPSRMTDDELVQAVCDNVYYAALSPRHSHYDDNCSALYRESVKRGGEGLYKRGYAKAARSAGIDL